MGTPPPPVFSISSMNKPGTLEERLVAKTPHHSAHPPREFKSEYHPNKAPSRFNYGNNGHVQTNIKCQPQAVAKPNIQGPKSAYFSRVPNFTKPPDKSYDEPSLIPNRSQASFQASKCSSNIAQRSQIPFVQDTRMPNQPPATATKAPLSMCQQTQPTPQNKSSYQMTRAYSEPTIQYQVKVKDKIYKILRKLGTGGSAKVYEGVDPQSMQAVAIKIINVARADARTRANYFNEQAILTKLRDCKYVVRIIDSEYKFDLMELVIVMEKGDADLSHVLESYFRNRSQNIDGLFVKFYWRAMLNAVFEIHEYGIVHADLKPVNFILVKNVVKLIDFGIANTIDPGGTSIIRDYQIGTINYMAPEALKSRLSESSENQKTIIKYNSKVDIWSLGCILYNLVYGKPPFDDYKELLSKMQAITDASHNIKFPRISNAKLLDCMKRCLRYDARDRPTAKELLEHPYLTEDVITMQTTR